VLVVELGLEDVVGPATVFEDDRVVVAVPEIL